MNTWLKGDCLDLVVANGEGVDGNDVVAKGEAVEENDVGEDEFSSFSFFSWASHCPASVSCG